MAFFVNGRDMSEALDRHITGNWGEDSVPSKRCKHCGKRIYDYAEYDECPRCGEEVDKSDLEEE